MSTVRSIQDNVANDNDPTEGALVEDTLTLWQPRAEKALAEEDAKEMMRNASGFFSVLDEWEAAAANDNDLNTIDPDGEDGHGG